MNLHTIKGGVISCLIWKYGWALTAWPLSSACSVWELVKTDSEGFLPQLAALISIVHHFMEGLLSRLQYNEDTYFLDWVWSFRVMSKRLQKAFSKMDLQNLWSDIWYQFGWSLTTCPSPCPVLGLWIERGSKYVCSWSVNSRENINSAPWDEVCSGDELTLPLPSFALQIVLPCTNRLKQEYLICSGNAK